MGTVLKRTPGTGWNRYRGFEDETQSSKERTSPMENLAFSLILASAFLFSAASIIVLFDVLIGYLDQMMTKHLTGD
jgi:hypothetical protein